MYLLDGHKVNKRFKKQRGFSLLELMLVLGAMMMLFVMVFKMIPAITLSKKARAEVRTMTSTVAGLLEYRNSRPDSQSLPSQEELIQAGLVLADQVIDGQWVSAEKNPVYLTGNSSAWAVEYQKVSQEFCRVLVEGSLAESPGAFQSVSINGIEAMSLGESSLIDLCWNDTDNRVIRFALSPDGVAGRAEEKKPGTLSQKQKKWGTSEEI